MERNRIRRTCVNFLVVATIFILSTMLTPFANHPPMTDDKTFLGSQTDEIPAPARALALMTHDPILIEGNANFTVANGVTRGSGTEADPYVIEGWEISSFSWSGIEIRNADAHFDILSCQVHNGTDPASIGIYLFSCSNGTIEDCNCSSNPYTGVYLAESSNNSLVNNTCSGNAYGVILSGSFNNSLVNNTCSNNSEFGIALSFSYDNTLVGNSCSNNTKTGVDLYNAVNNNLERNTMSSNILWGIFVYLSDHNTLSGNNCSNSDCGIRLYDAKWNTLTNNTCTHNQIGLILFYPSNSTVNGNDCSSNIDYGIYVQSSDNTTLSDNICSSNNGDGISIGFSANTVLVNNTCESNKGAAVALYDSGMISVSGCRFSNNTGYGLTINGGTNSSNNRIWNNTFYHNNGASDIYDASHVQAYDGGEGNWWDSTDGYGNYWSDWTSPDVLPPYGIVDVAYILAGSAGAQDLFPQTMKIEPIPEFSTLPAVVIVMLIAVLLTAGVRRRKA